jgi:hypothetical protein
MTIYFDSSALTAGTVQAADPHLRGATMGLHSMAGYTGGFIGPLGVGLVLDLCGGDSVNGWGLAFGHLARWGQQLGDTMVTSVGDRKVNAQPVHATFAYSEFVTITGLLVLRKLGRIGG